MSDAAVDLTTPPFLAPVIWNYMLEIMSSFTIISCAMFGSYGLFWLNDNGEMMEKCYVMYGGTLPTYDTPPSGA